VGQLSLTRSMSK